MKQQFLWMALLMSGLFGSSFCGYIGTDKCDSDGIVGTFSVDARLNSLTITPVNFTNNLEVHINKTIDASPDQGIQLYLTLDGESECKGELTFNFQITATDETCEFSFVWDHEKTVNINVTKDSKPVYNDPFIASFEVRREGDEFNTVIKDGSGAIIATKNKTRCIDIHETIGFQLKFPTPAEKDSTECGVQLEMKGEYNATMLKMNNMKEVCLLEPAGTSNADGGITTIATTTEEQQEDEPFPVWAIASIVVGAVLIILVVTFLIVYFVILPKRRAALVDDVEDAADAPEGEVGTPDELVKTSEEIQDD